MEWFKSLLFKCCNFNPNMMKVVMFDISNADIIEKNTCIILIATYLTHIWIAGKAELTHISAIKLIQSKIMYNKGISLLRLKATLSSIFTDSYKNLEFGNMKYIDLIYY